LNRFWLNIGCDWYLYIKLDEKRESDPALSWDNSCEAPSTVRSTC